MKKFDRGHYREFQLPQWFNGPEALTETLYQAWSRRYKDLYERGGECDVEETFEEVIKALGVPVDRLSHWRYSYMAWIFSMAAMPTIKHYYPEDWKYFLVQKQVLACLEEGSEIPDELADTLFAKPTIRNYQTADEAYSVLYNYLKSLHRQLAYDAVIDILYDAITGDAISGFAAAKRDIFNWWLIEVIRQLIV